MTSSEAPRLQYGSVSALAFLVSADWWQQALASVFAFAPRCAVPAAMVAGANVVAVITQAVIMDRLAGSANGEMDIVGLLTISLVSLLIVIIALVLSLVGLSMWLVRLTGYARSTMETGRAVHENERFEAAIHEVKAQKDFLTRVWLIASAYLLLPVMPLSVCIAIKMASEMQVLGQPLLNVPSSVLNGATIAAVILSAVTTAYSLTTIVFSSVAREDVSAVAVANAGLKQCLKRFLSVALLTLTVIALNVVLTMPYLLLIFSDATRLVRQHVELSVLAQLWLGVSTTVVWPLSVLMFCQLCLSSGDQ